MRTQDKKAETDLVQKEIEQGSWEDSKSQSHRRKQVKLLQPILCRDMLVLDAGCGIGTYGLILAEENEVIGIDISYKATRVGRQKARETGVKFSPLVGDLEKLPFKANSFDLCLCAYTLHHFPDIRTAIRELARVLKPGGKLALLEPNGSNPVVRLSGRLEKMVGERLITLGLDTPNETLHEIGSYANTLNGQGFENVVVNSHYYGGMPPLPKQCSRVILILVRLRCLLYSVVNRLLGSPIGGADLLIVATKRLRSPTH